MTVRFQHRLWSWAGAALVAAGAAGVIAPSLTRADEKGEKAEGTAVIATTHIGELKGGPESARIAFVVEGDQFVAYVCSADQPFNDTFSRWFRGAMKGGSLSAKVGGTEVTATVSGGAVSGTLKGGGQAHEFTARVVAADGNAGLFRAGESFGEDDYVIGWIADEKGTVVGTGGKRGGKVQTLQPPKENGNLNAQIGDKKVPAGKVTGADPKASGTGKKFDAAARGQFLKDLVDQRKEEGGNAIQAMVLHQVRRFDAGKRAETKLEEKVFAALKKAPAGTLTKYLKDWDALPVATRDTLLGATAKQLDAGKPLDGEQAKKFVQGMPQLGKFKELLVTLKEQQAQGTVKGVSITTVKCVSETLPKFLGQDEVFALHAVVVGSSGPVFKQTGVIREFDDGVTHLFPAADKGVFPLAGLTPTAGADVTVVTTLFEDDGAVLLQVLGFLKPLIEAVAVIVLEEVAEAKGLTLDATTKEALKVGVKGVIDGAVSGLGSLLVQPLGTDEIVVRPNGLVVGSNGAPKSKMVFKRVRKGDVLNDYELFGFDIQK